MLAAVERRSFGRDARLLIRSTLSLSLSASNNRGSLICRRADRCFRNNPLTLIGLKRADD